MRPSPRSFIAAYVMSAYMWLSSAPTNSSPLTNRPALPDGPAASAQSSVSPMGGMFQKCDQTTGGGGVSLMARLNAPSFTRSLTASMFPKTLTMASKRPLPASPSVLMDSTAKDFSMRRSLTSASDVALAARRIASGRQRLAALIRRVLLLPEAALARDLALMLEALLALLVLDL